MKKLIATLSLIAALTCVTTAQSIGHRVKMMGQDNKTYTGTIIEIKGANYLVKYEGYDFKAWLTKEQFTIVSSTLPSVKEDIPNTQLNAVFQFGVSRGWTTQIQVGLLSSYLASLTNTSKQQLITFVEQAHTSSAKFFVLKSLLAGDDFTTLQKFIDDLNLVNEQEQQQRCLATSRKSIIQQWQFSCSVTSVQTYLAELSPRYCWEVKKIPTFNEVDATHSNGMAEQQKQLLEHYGGVATARGDLSGKAIGILQPLNQLVGPVVRSRFYAVQVNDNLSEVFAAMQQQLNDGLMMPLLINFEGSDAAHFVLVMQYQPSASGNKYLIYDPWEGVTDYVTESSLRNKSLSPLLATSQIKIAWYYPATKLTSAEIDAIQEERKIKGF